MKSDLIERLLEDEHELTTMGLKRRKAEREEAAAALEQFQWRPIKDMPDEMKKKGTLIDIWHKAFGRLTTHWWCGDETFCGISPQLISHYKVITTPPEKETT